MSTVEKLGPVSLDEVKVVIGLDDPFNASASLIREIIGRGSNTTIQKHINELRQKATDKLKAVSSELIPPAPPEVFSSIWTSAYSFAMSSVLIRMEKLSSERDVLIASSTAQIKDVETFALEVDELLEKLASAEDLAEKAAVEVQMQAARDKSKTDQMGEELIAARDQLTRVVAETNVTAQLAAHDKALVEATLQRTIDSLTTQIAELKGWLFPRESNKLPEKLTASMHECDLQLE